MLIQKIPKSEFKVMKFIWEINDVVTSKMLREAMKDKYGWEATTTLTFLKNLVEKHFLDAERINRLTHYKILITEKEYKNYVTKKFLEDIHDNSLESLAESLLLINKAQKK
ncbi:transcriptional regulator [Clostridioides difficile]|uniref:BlaI/MecI/CopY family transcriptional regulator n=1 Tax=Clostridioides difficile TaxID=1496 RepID=UPI000BB18DCF|nr:BlaI/MecI/CopY family transcriptional regulator [Clostridioides difficile]MBY1700019.1 BlaI/MecI/CopY family transcriptional regulator [Clostridioides difficile]MBY2483385.1 BlaI/MecI/CopY family transcriptional regulator [Clostridioides difficile]MBY2557776.1 BlaI/MecI/CopY family transcriptional regulator [Clostridioides difficile]MBZ1301445.1 BlaI/MecI/CopY family transcriptional regulator [Clostridioides difficile]MCH4299830.1 BlaI/MecI/CopY family transcriptional regulator [Clostridioi